MSEKMASPTPVQSDNMGVDYVILYKYDKTDKGKSAEQFQKLIESLDEVGLATEVRRGENNTLLVFVKAASQESLYGEAYRTRIQDWVHSVRIRRPEQDSQKAIEEEPLHEAERLRVLNQLITNSKAQGGAGITPKTGEWKDVDSIFALHDHEFNKQWIKHWSKKYLLTEEDLDEIRNRLGEKIAYYFAFTQTYFQFLIFPAAFGFSAWLLFGHFSLLYAVVNMLWCIIFTEYWKHKEIDLAVRWGVRGVSRIESQRLEFRHDKIVRDEVTGEEMKVFPARKRLQRQALQLPFVIASAIVLGSLIAMCFGIEIFMREIYNGPGKAVLVFLPVGILTSCLPILTTILTETAKRLTEFENYETHGAYQAAMTQKIFVLNFITSYLAIFLTAFVYVPFGSIIVPYLDVFKVTVKHFAESEDQMTAPKEGFSINPNRLRMQVIYFTVTAQVVNLCMEVIVPYLKRRGMAKFKEMQDKKALNGEGRAPTVSEHDHPDEAAFLARVRNEVELETYDVTADLREMVLQFGYLSLFSVVWPLVGCSFLANNWVELRADAVKICVEMRRPTPWRADTIGPWLDSLSFLTWLGSLTSAALVYMFSNDGVGPDGDPYTLRGWALLLTVLASEHVFFVVKWAVRVAMARLESPGLLKERRERYLFRRTFFEESFGEVKRKRGEGEKMAVDRQGLEEMVRSRGGKDISAGERFWARQRGWRECAKEGVGIILKGEQEGKKEK